MTAPLFEQLGQRRSDHVVVASTFRARWALARSRRLSCRLLNDGDQTAPGGARDRPNKGNAGAASAFVEAKAIIKARTPASSRAKILVLDPSHHGATGI